MATIKTPECGTQFQVGPNSFIYVIDTEDNAYEDRQGRTIVTGHDDNGDEVEVRFFPRQPEDGYDDEDDE